MRMEMTKLLPTIQSPADMKRLSNEQLTQLASEIRQRIIDVVVKNGGHLASNLGITELTIAVWPWLLTMLVFLIIVTYWPALSIWLPKTLGMM